MKRVLFRHTIAILLCCTVTAVTVPSEVFAQDESKDERARRLYEVGAEFYDAGRYEAAIEAFEEAYALSGRHALLVNISSAYEKLGNLEKAIELLEKYQPHSGKKKVAIAKRIDSMKKRAQEMAEANKAADTPSQVPAATEPAAEEKPTNYAAWGATVGGGVLLVAGVATYMLGESTHADLQSEIDDGHIDLTDPAQLSQAEDDDADGDSKKLIGYSLMGVGGAALVAGAVLFALDGSEESEDDVAFQVVPTRDGGLVSFGGSF